MVLASEGQVKQLLASVRSDRPNMQQTPALKSHTVLIQYCRLCCDGHGSRVVIVCNPGMVGRVPSASEHVPVVLEKETQKWGCTNKTTKLVSEISTRATVSHFSDGTVFPQFSAASRCSSAVDVVQCCTSFANSSAQKFGGSNKVQAIPGVENLHVSAAHTKKQGRSNSQTTHSQLAQIKLTENLFKKKLPR